MGKRDKAPQELVCTRLADMTIMHPHQLETICANCHHTVGVYPTGQRAMKRWPKMRVICVQCCLLDRALTNDYRSAGTPEEIAQEHAESKPVIHD